MYSSMCNLFCIDNCFIGMINCKTISDDKTRGTKSI